jgi:hydroxyacylglutathione hydrolase
MKIEQILVGHMQVFCYLVYDEDTMEGILIDPAGDEDKLAAHLAQKGVKLAYIVNTHGHADHTCGNDRLKNATGAKVVMHATDDTFYQMPANQNFARMMGLAPPGPADVRIEDGGELVFGKVKAKFIQTPGHTKGSCCILIDSNLFTGDTLFVGAVGRTDLPGGSFDELIQSLKMLVSTLPPETVVWPGHDYGDRPSSTIGREAKTNPYITDFVD